jgi:hypothetical protein
MPRFRRIALLSFLTIAVTLAGAAPAGAIFHLVKIREVAPESSPGAGDAFVELQMYQPGQRFISTHTIHVYSASGSDSGPLLMSGPDPPNGDNQRTVLIGGAGVDDADFNRNELSDRIDGDGGAVCFDETEVDCVSWGSFSNVPGLPVGMNAAAIPGGMSLTRTIARGCATYLDDSDDTDNSLGDFSVSARSPRPNSVPPTERPCASGGGTDRNPPETFLTRRPPNRSFDRRPTFRFRSDEGRARFECQIPPLAYRLCSSPFTTRRLSYGLHVFRVRARDRANNRDRTPAKDFFRILRRP